jgi:hypothetical protein
MENTELKLLLNRIEMQLEWGPSINWQGKDFERLNQLIFDKTKVSLSASTLRRLWGKVDYKHQPSGTTLDTLSKFAGYSDWRSFNKQFHNSPETSTATSTLQHAKIDNHIRLRTMVLLIGIILAGYGFYKWRNKKKITKKTNYAYLFNSKPVIRDIPNSVVFSYDAHAAPNDSVYIQQSWDNHRRTKVNKALHYHTSIYYRPGFYRAKLIIGKEIVKEHPLILATDNWLGLVAQGTVPLYLSKKDFTTKQGLTLSPSDYGQIYNRISSNPPTLEFYNVGNFTPIAFHEFSFHAEVRSNMKNMGAKCQYINIVLFTNGIPIVIPLSAPGCISELNLFNGQIKVSGKSADLSGFGADLSKWTDIICREEKNYLRFFVNNKLAYQSSLPQKYLRIIGMGFIIQGAGNVRRIELNSNQHRIFSDF